MQLGQEVNRAEIGVICSMPGDDQPEKLEALEALAQQMVDGATCWHV